MCVCSRAKHCLLLLPRNTTFRWSHYLDELYIDDQTGTSFIQIDGGNPPRTVSPVDSMVAALDSVARVNSLSGCFESNETATSKSCLVPIVFYSELDEELGDTLLDAALAHAYPPAVFLEPNGDHLEPDLVNNRTLVLSVDFADDQLAHLRVNFDSETWTVSNFTHERIDLGYLPSEYKDEQYIEDMTYLRSLADKAIENDPVVGTSTFMPFTRIDDWRMCMGGECPIGNLFTDAIRWVSDADFAVLPSGGLRGEGWGAGDVRVSDIWGALPFLNTVCTGVMSGVSVFQLFNYSTAVATFESTYTLMGDRLLQMSGKCNFRLGKSFL